MLTNVSKYYANLQENNNLLQTIEFKLNVY